MSIDPKVLQIGRSHPRVLSELERMDTAARRGLGVEQRRQILPYHYRSSPAFDGIWFMLGRGEINESEALERFGVDMKAYYAGSST